MVSYIYPPTFRSQMAELWGLPEIHHWWLPHDEGYPAIVRDIRGFIEDRTSQSPTQPRSEDLRNVKTIFSKMSVHSNVEQEHDRPERGGSDSHAQSPTHGELTYHSTMQQSMDMDLQHGDNGGDWW